VAGLTTTTTTTSITMEMKTNARLSKGFHQEWAKIVTLL